MKRKIVCLVGKRKDWRELRMVEAEQTFEGNIVLTIGCLGPDGDSPFTHNDTQVGNCKELHFDKITMADEVLLVSDEIGEDTKADLLHALRLGKIVRFYHQSHEQRIAIIHSLRLGKVVRFYP